MKYTKTKLKKPYTSPELSIHELGFEGALLYVSAEADDQPAVGPWGVRRLTKVPKGDDTPVCFEEELLEEADMELMY